MWVWAWHGGAWLDVGVTVLCERDWAWFECGRGMGGAWTVVYPGRLSSGWGMAVVMGGALVCVEVGHVLRSPSLRGRGLGRVVMDAGDGRWGAGEKWKAAGHEWTTRDELPGESGR